MTQAKHPTLDEIEKWTESVRIDLAHSAKHQTHQHFVDARIICRVYDRRSGNFKAMGWLVRLQYAHPYARSFLIVMLDSELEQSKLT